MSSPSFFTRLLPLRQQPYGGGRHHWHQAAVSTPSSFRILGFRPVDSSTSQYHTLINELRNQEQFPFTMAPTVEVDVAEDASPRRKRVKTHNDPPKLQCRICFTDVDGDQYITPCRSCKRPQCFECVKRQWLVALSDHESFPARCCNSVLFPDVAQGILPPAELAIYKSRYDESNTPNPFYCPIPTCSTFVPPRMLKPERGKVHCPICASVSCYKCRQVASEEHQCNNMDEKATILKAFHYKLCPKCGTGIMRMYGCNHVRCSCGSHWCWSCQRPVNACYASPCNEAGGEGSESEVDGGDIESEQDDADSAREVTVSEIVMVVDSAAPVTAEAGPSHDASEWPASEATAMAETTQAPAPDSSTEVGEVKQEEQTTQPQETTVNLDDPDDPDNDWEGGDFDFGEEPSDEYWDIWGCMHKYRNFTAEQVPEKWMVGLNRERSFGIECMACFKNVKIEGKKPVFEGPKTFEEWKAEIQEMDKAAAAGEVETEAAVKAAKKEKRKSKKTGASECKQCGVIHCWNCRRAAVRRLTTYRKGVR